MSSRLKGPLLVLNCIFFLMLLCPNVSLAKVLPGQKSISAIDTGKPLSSTALDGLSLRDLWLLKNEIYARHGKPFSTYELHAYFLKKGFKPDKAYSDSRLTPVEIRNAVIINKKIKEIEAVCVTGGKNPKLDEGCIANVFQYGAFTKGQMRRIETNGFVVTPAKHEQLYHVYEEDEYDKIPNFITTDSLLQVYSILFDNTLRHAEEGKLGEDLQKFTKIAMAAARRNYETCGADPAKKKAAWAALAYFSVPYVLLTGNSSKINKDVKSVIDEELSRINAHASLSPPAILAAINPAYKNSDDKELWIDYTQFAPRGHYTRTPWLKSYFKASLWYGLYGFHLTKGFDETALAALYVKNALIESKAVGLWQNIMNVTAFYAGSSDDLTPTDLDNIAAEAFGKGNNYSGKDSFEKFFRLAGDEYEAKTEIRHVCVDAAGNQKEQGAEFMLMGQRYIPDSEVMQRLVKANIAGSSRLFPKGLDVMAAFGDATAQSLMLGRYKGDWQDGLPGYPKELEKLKAKFSRIDDAGWKKNLYMSWLWTLKALFEAQNNGNRQFFLRSRAWQAKSLSTSLASWAELRHNTILYSKQSLIAAESGEGGEDHWVWFPAPPRGYVEPNAEFFKRLIVTIDLSRSALKASGLMDKNTEKTFSIFREMAVFLKGIVDKENKGVPRTSKEYARIERFGGELEHLTLRILVMARSGGAAEWTANGVDEDSNIAEGEWDTISKYEKRIPVIADVHSAYDSGQEDVLEEGVGWANDIYVAVKDGGMYRLMRGPVFSYYEFLQTASNRLTDEKWQDRLVGGKNIPAVPGWTDIFESASPAAGPGNSYREGWSGTPGWKLIYY